MTTSKKGAPAGDVAEQIQTEQDQGFVGDKVDPLPNSAHSMEGGAPKREDQK